MADFQSIPINGTAEKLEKILAMDISNAITEDSTDDQIPTALAVHKALKSIPGNEEDAGVFRVVVFNDGENVNANKKFNEIAEAFKSGASVFAVLREHPYEEETIFQLIRYVEDVVIVFGLVEEEKTKRIYFMSDGTITVSNVGTDIKAVLYTEQDPTPEQQAQARKNIGAAAVGEGGGSLSAEIIDNILVINLPGNLTASIQNGVLTVA